MESPPVYMYSAYERTWHWLQALAILVLLATGIEIHVTRLGIIDFALAVRIHNIVGFVVLANAVFAAFFHLASGEIQQYCPSPRGSSTRPSARPASTLWGSSGVSPIPSKSLQAAS